MHKIPQLILGLSLTIALATAALALEPFAAAEVKVEATNDVGASPVATVEFKAEFALSDSSDGLAPESEDTELLIGPDPARDPSSWVAHIPAGCFQPGMRGHEVVDFRGCGVRLLSKDRDTGAETDLTRMLTAFEASLGPPRSRGPQPNIHIVLGISIFFEVGGTEVFGGIIPCMLDFRVGNDGIEALMYASQFEAAAAHPPDPG